MNANLKKLLRFTTIYGISRAFNKAAGRLRHKYIRSYYWLSPKRNVSVIGSGQFAFSTIGYFLKKNKGKVMLDCYDIERKNAESLAHYYRIERVADTAEQVLENKELEILYIASNHATHTPYAIQAMDAGIRSIYTEKPISVNYDQLVCLIAKQKQTKTTLFAGYNRPYSGAVFLLKDKVKNLPEQKGGFSIAYFISGHQIGDDHWYRVPEEGTRVCGNMGHWIDLSIHMLAWRQMPNQFKIQIAYSNTDEPDDDVNVSITSDLNDIITIFLTSRSEPFEGINETINFQYQNIIAKIDDFRRIEIHEGHNKTKKSFFPKDVGHQRAILQPYKDDNRDWDEVILSSLVMLNITNMVRNRMTDSLMDINKELANFNRAVEIKS